MADSPASKTLRKRKEALLFIAALALTIIFVRGSLDSWLRPETWGQPITTATAAGAPAPKITPADFSAIWTNGGRNPFGDAATPLESAGQVGIPLPPLPPLYPEMPPPPRVAPLDLLTGGAP